ncbi:MAG: DUF1579 domain-containing protein [Bryobacterales bacterium]|nr:DUF1579 domain-containing protein [Bryobacterales bacterium]
MTPELTREHEWLQRFVGEWEYEMVHPSSDGGEPGTFRGKETVRSLNGAWVLFEGQGCMGGAGESSTLMTLGYDSRKQCFVGSWVGSMMTHLWCYTGELNADETELTLLSEGPSFADPTATANYRDIIEVVDGDNRILRGELQAQDGSWSEFMRMPYRRVGATS